MNTRTGEDQSASGWYVVYTRPKQELRALENLQNQGFSCFLPTMMVDRLREGRRITVAEPLFPRYLFVRLEAGCNNWSAIHSTRGAVGLVKFGGRATRAPGELVEALREQLSFHRALFEPGDRLRVTAGPFAGIEAELLRLYETPDGEARVLVLMGLLGFDQRINLPACEVRKVA